MKLLSMRIDDFLLDLVNFFIHREDIQDIQLAESRLHEKDLPFEGL